MTFVEKDHGLIAGIGHQVSRAAVLSVMDGIWVKTGTGGAAGKDGIGSAAVNIATGGADMTVIGGIIARTGRIIAAASISTMG